MNHHSFMNFRDRILQDIFQMNQKASSEEVLRVLLMGLPYSGIEEVALILNQEYGLTIFQVNLELKPKDVSAKKYVREACFQQFRQVPKAVIILPEYRIDLFQDLKKRNYLNIVMVESTFQNRFKTFLRKNNREETIQAAKQFMDIDDKSQNQEYQGCLDYVRVRIVNKGVGLRQQIKKKQGDIIRYFRPTWDQYFMKIADIARRRSNCMKTSVGAVIVNDENRVVSTGYNGTPKQIPSCYKFGCERCNNNEGKQLDQCLCLHAQQSAIIEVGIGKTQGCRLYTTYYPCFSCAKIIKQAGIKKIYYMDEYEKEDSGKPFIQIYFKPQNVKKISADNLYY